jgi:hypothetical protein
MAVTVQMQFASAVTGMYQDAFVGSSIANGATIIPCDLRPRDFQPEGGVPATLAWRQEASHVDMHALSTFHNPMKYRFILTQGYCLDTQPQRLYCTPEIKGVSTAQPMSHSILRLACSLAVVCGVSLRHIAVIFAALFLLPLTQSSIRDGLTTLVQMYPVKRRCCSHGSP